jgi:hypothetical protein
MNKIIVFRGGHKFITHDTPYPFTHSDFILLQQTNLATCTLID